MQKHKEVEFGKDGEKVGMRNIFILAAT